MKISYYLHRLTYTFGLFLSLLLIGMHAEAQEQNSTFFGHSKFDQTTQKYPTEVINNSLLFEAFFDILKQAMLDLQLDYQLFQNNFDSQFTEYFNKNLSLFSNEGKTEGQSEQGMKAAARLKFMRATRLNQVIPTYRIVELANSAEDPQRSFMKLEGKVNLELLKKIYGKFTCSNNSNINNSDSNTSTNTNINTSTGNGDNRNRKKYLYLNTEIQVRDIQWKDLGIPTQEDLQKTLENGWQKLFEQKFSMDIAGTLVTRDNLEEKLLEIQGPDGEETKEEGPEEKLIQPQLGPKTSEVEKNHTDSETGKDKNRPIVETDALWLRIKVNIKKISDHEILQRRELAITLDLLLVDMASGLPVAYDEIKSPSYFFSYQNLEELGAQIAGLIYRLPLPNFKHMGNTIKTLPPSLIKRDLKILEVESLESVFLLQEKLMAKGMGQTVKAKMRFFRLPEKEASLALWMEEQYLSEFEDRLRRLDRFELENGTLVTSEPSPEASAILSPTQLPIRLKMTNLNSSEEEIGNVEASHQPETTVTNENDSKLNEIKEMKEKENSDEMLLQEEGPSPQ